jgi:two-component system, OmpR family, response regulator ResD
MPRVLVVDDDPDVAQVVLAYLRRDGFDAAHADDGLKALESARRAPPDLVVLDLMLPGLDGLEVCRRLHQDAPELPVIMLTARGEELDRIAGLEVGADDYIVKPFSPRELVLRVMSVLRRRQAQSAATTSALLLDDGDLVVDPVARTTLRGGKPLSLTVREFDLLAYLLRRPGIALRREELMRDVWGWDFGDLSTVTVHVRRLREKVEVDPATPTRIVTVWGVGYRWEPQAGSAAYHAAAEYGSISEPDVAQQP